jgi:hypothetical protein
MMLVRRLCLPFLLLLANACTTVTDWRELQSAPMTLGECYDGLAFIAQNDGFAPDVSTCDRGNGIWQSRWRMRQVGLNRPGRYRLRAEIIIEEGSKEKGWPLRFAIDQQKVKDLRRSNDPTEDDWSDAGQDGEREAIFGDKLARRLAVKT